MRRGRRWWPRLLVAVFVTILVGVGPPVVAGADAGSPGSVIAVDPLPGAASVPGSGTEYRLTYRTADHRGAPRISTGAVYLPPGDAPPGGWPIISYAHGTVGVADVCAPSAVGTIRQESDFLARWLSRGYAVVGTDYAGLGTPGGLAYLDGLAAAHNVVDMVRAARAVSPELSSRWIAVGMSQGGHAALHTAHVASDYAPELDFRGAVALGPPTNLEQAVPLARPGLPNLGLAGLTKFVLYMLVGMRDARPELDVDSYLSPAGAELADRAFVHCSADLNPYVGNLSVGDLLSRPLDPLRPEITEYLGVPTSGYSRPIFVGQGVVDRVVPLPLTLAFVAQATAAHTPLTFRGYPGADHLDTFAAAFDDAAVFADAVLR